LYGVVGIPEDPIPVSVEPFVINNDTPTEADSWAVVKGLQNGRVGGKLGIKLST